MKKVTAVIAFVCALGALANLPSAKVSLAAPSETISPLAMMQESRTLPSESYDTY